MGNDGDEEGILDAVVEGVLGGSCQYLARAWASLQDGRYCLPRQGTIKRVLAEAVAASPGQDGTEG